MSASNARANTSLPAASTLRPRTTRLISGLDEGDETTFDAATAAPRRIASPIPPPFDRRSVSPVPLPQPQRSPNSQRSRDHAGNGSSSRAGSVRPRKPGADSSNSLAGLWGNSWTAIQGIASDLLGSDLAPANGLRSRRSVGRLQSGQRGSASVPPGYWGPSAPASSLRPGDIGAGTREQHTADFRARKRKDMLTGQESSYADALGKFKRRMSDDRNSVSAPPGENEDRDALVYLHHVSKDDTLFGITIRYNISANALRKANRMWPNDAVQARQILVLPVDVCGVKGKPVSGSEGYEDLLVSESESLAALHAEEVPTTTATTTTTALLNGSAGHYRSRTNSSSAHTVPSIAGSSSALEPPWHHDSWVLLPGNQKPTEIARLSRRALGYFPPARRKSNSYSDLDTPSTSLDLARPNTDDLSEQTATTSYLRQTPPQKSRRARRPSNANNGYFPTHLIGPGGVGTMSKNVHFPGPAQDGLNKMFAKHLPDVAPPRNQNQLYLPEMPLYTDETTPVASGSATPAHPHAHGSGLNFENVGGAIESWVRKLATKAHSMPQDRQQAARVSVGTPGKGAGGIGDLIEMTNEFEIGGDEDEDEESSSRGRQGSKSQAVLGQPSSSATSYFDGATTRRGTSGVASRGSKSGKAD